MAEEQGSGRFEADPFAQLRQCLPDVMRALSRHDIDCDEPQASVAAGSALLALSIEQAASRMRLDPMLWPYLAVQVARNLPRTVAQLAAMARRQASSAQARPRGDEPHEP